MPTVVLILDADLGLVFWLGEIFSEAGCKVVPSLNSEQARSITLQLKLEVDVIVVDPGLAGVSELIRTLSYARPVKIVVIREDSYASGTIHDYATLERPPGTSRISRAEWLARVRRLLLERPTTRNGPREANLQ